jgi:DNA-directed RNA polymerase specialized sigma24 family protein
MPVAADPEWWMRFYRVEDMDIYESKDAVLRSDEIREMVDALPKKQRHMVERVYFGGSHVQSAGAEIGLSPSNAQLALSLGLEALRGSLSPQD